MGYGAGLNYFFTENWGVGVDSYADAFTVPYLLNGNVFFRYPLQELSLAPYAFAGVGREWTHAPQWQGDFGGGIEYRWKPAMAFFTDVRWVIPDETDNYLVWRFGFRFAL